MCLLVLLLMNGDVEAPPAKTLEPVSRRLRRTFPLGAAKSFNPIAFLDDGTLLGSNDAGAWTINVDDGRLDRRVLFEQGASILRVVLSADQRTLFIARAGKREEKLVKDGVSSTIYRELGGLSAYDVATGRKLPIFNGREPTSVTDLVASPDGWRLPSAPGLSTLKINPTVACYGTSERISRRSSRMREVAASFRPIHASFMHRSYSRVGKANWCAFRSLAGKGN